MLCTRWFHSAGQQHPPGWDAEQLPSAHQGPKHPSPFLRHRRGRGGQPGGLRAGKGVKMFGRVSVLSFGTHSRLAAA